MVRRREPDLEVLDALKVLRDRGFRAGQVAELLGELQQAEYRAEHERKTEELFDNCPI